MHSPSCTTRLPTRRPTALSSPNACFSLQAKFGSVVAFSEPLPKPLTVAPEDLPLDVIYEDEHLLVRAWGRMLDRHSRAG